MQICRTDLSHFELIRDNESWLNINTWWLYTIAATLHCLSPIWPMDEMPMASPSSPQKINQIHTSPTYQKTLHPHIMPHFAGMACFLSPWSITNSCGPFFMLKMLGYIIPHPYGHIQLIVSFCVVPVFINCCQTIRWNYRHHSSVTEPTIDLN